MPEWEQAVDFLRFDSGVNIQVNASDIPGIADVDGDGDLDILAYRFTTASTIDYYQNTGVDNGDCEQLTFTRATRRWGEFAECECNTFAFSGSQCSIAGAANTSNDLNGPNAVAHAGGKTILVFDNDNDGDLDLITSDEFCQTLYFMENVGDAQNALMTSFESYPATHPAAFQIFPSASLLDVDFDGNKDLVVSTNADANVANSIDFTTTSKLYTNGANNLNPSFNTASVPFLQNDMLDLGENTYPATADFDGDGDLDLFVGTRGLIDQGQFSASVFMFENTGGRFSPAFELIENDFLDLKSEALRNIKIQFADVNADGRKDFIYQSTTAANETKIRYRLNQGNFSFGAAQEISISVNESDNPYFYDVNGDGHLDLLLATRFGGLSLYTNEGNFSFTAPIVNYAGIEPNFLALNPSVFIVDLDSDGIVELVKTDLSGEVKIYAGAIGEDFTPSSITTNLLQNSLRNDLSPSNIGEVSWLTAADLYGEGKPTLIIGNNRGGINLLKNESTSESATDSRPIQLTLFPNPTLRSFFIRTDADATASMFNVSGQKVFDALPIQAGVSTEINTESLAAGIYLVRVTNGLNAPSVKRILIQK